MKSSGNSTSEEKPLHCKRNLKFLENIENFGKFWLTLLKVRIIKRVANYYIIAENPGQIYFFLIF